jgi:hypothetical protein
MRFYKICGRHHPTHRLPTVLWDPRTDKAAFEFIKTDVPDVLGCDVEDPELIDMCISAGYITEKPAGPNINRMALSFPTIPEGTELPQPPLTEATKTALRRTK